MSMIVQALERHARSRPSAIAIAYAGGRIEYRDLAVSVRRLAADLDGRVVGLLAGNGPAWVAADLALQLRGATCVPLPPFFSTSQLAHVVADAGIDLILADDPARVEALIGGKPATTLPVLGQTLYAFALAKAGSDAGLEGISKVTYTSGTTGEPKGVCLGGDGIERVANALCEASQASCSDRALCTLPLSILLENIGCVYVPLLAGAQIGFAAPDLGGVAAAGRVTPSGLAAALRALAPTAAVLVPQQLRAWVEAAESGECLPESLRFVAVGGAPISESLLRRALRTGIPVYEGYGLSEACSVVCLNRPNANRFGTAGRPLPHAEVRIAGDGEVLVAGALFERYLRGAPRAAAYWPTGDLGYLDSDGYLVLTGRKNSAYATAWGRNVAPEWVERELLAEPSVAQAMVFGEARPFNVALIVPRPGYQREVAAAVARANRRLPAYARVLRFAVAMSALAPSAARFGGTPARRQQIWNRYRDPLESLYEEELDGVL